ncbi:MAG: hypothetical protein Q7V63_08975 [Gammaproteobacteria bacterium]|nr:hypothetical protein [Gammaproteobacteria bacterium]
MFSKFVKFVETNNLLQIAGGAITGYGISQALPNQFFGEDSSMEHTYAGYLQEILLPLAGACIMYGIAETEVGRKVSSWTTYVAEAVQGVAVTGAGILLGAAAKQNIDIFKDETYNTAAAWSIAGITMATGVYVAIKPAINTYKGPRDAMAFGRRPGGDETVVVNPMDIYYAPLRAQRSVNPD